MESEPDPDIVREERAIYTLLIVVGLVVVVRFAFNYAAITGGVTLCIVMIGLGIVGIVGTRRRRRNQLPGARTVGRR